MLILGAIVSRSHVLSCSYERRRSRSPIIKSLPQKFRRKFFEALPKPKSALERYFLGFRVRVCARSSRT